MKASEVIADVGSGSRYFTLRLAHHVGTTGHVYRAGQHREVATFRRLRRNRTDRLFAALFPPAARQPR